MTRFLSILLLLYAIPFIHTQQASEYETVKPLYDQNVDLTQGQTKLYRIDLVDRQSNFDVAILALPYRGSAPQVFAAKTSEQLVAPDQAPYSTKDTNGEVLYIRQEDLNNEQSIYVKLVCNAAECLTHLTFEYSKEFPVEANGFKAYQTSSSLAGTTLGVVRVHLPQVADADRIVIHAEAIPTRQLESAPQFDMLIEQGDKIPHTSRVSNIPRTSWFTGKTIVIHKDHPLFCPTCNYTLSLKLSENISISVFANVYGPNVNLSASPIVDGVQQGKLNSYMFTIHDQQDDFIIDVRPQQGNITLYVDCGNQISQDYKKYYWSYEVLPDEEIVFTPKEHARCQNGAYYIIAYGQQDSVYSIRALWKEGSSRLELKEQSETVGDLFPGETISYDILMPIFIAEGFMVDVTVGSQLDTLLINCKFPSDCPGLIPAQLEAVPTAELTRNDTEFKFDIVDMGTETKLKTRFIINPHEEGGCYPILIKDKRFMDVPIPVCAYQLVLHSNQPNPVEYTLNLQFHGHEWLFPGLAKMDMVKETGENSYMLYVPHKDLQKVAIQVTKFSGDVDVFVSRSEKYPNETTDDTKFSHEGMIIYSQPPLNGTYYITVKGEQVGSSSTYSLSTFVMGGDGKLEDYALALQEGVPQKGVILPNNEHPVQYYKLNLEQEEGWEGTLRISLNPHRGNLVMVVNSNDMIPLPTVSNWNTTKHDLEISSTDPNFKRSGTYHIGLYMDWGNEEALGWADIPFTIVYYLQEKGKDGGQVSNKNHLLLTSAVPFHGKLKKGEIKYFEVQIGRSDQSVIIYKQSDVGGVDLYISREPSVEYPGPDNFTYTTALSHTNKLELNAYDIREICQESMVIVICTFYMSVVPSSNLAETSFSLHVERKSTLLDLGAQTPLEDGKRLIRKVPDDEDPVIFYFYPHSRESSVVTVACPGKHITIYASKQFIEIGSSLNPDIEPPTTENYVYSSKHNGFDTVGIAHLTIPPQSELNGTVVALAVYFQSLSSISNEYSIVVSAHSTRIYTGQAYHSSVQNDSYVYFNFDVAKDDCNLLVALTTLDDGNPDLLVSFGENMRPIIGNAQFSSISDQRTEVIEVSNLDILPLKSMAGTWSIGVYGRTASSFTLTVIYEDQKTVELKSGIPFEMLLSERSKMYFKYYHEENNNIEIRLDRFSGDVVAYVLNINQNEEYQTNLPNATYNDWTINPEFQSSLRINTTNSDSCVNCLYLIGLETKVSSKFIISVNEDIKFVKLQNGIHYRQEMEPTSSKVYVFNSPNADEVFLNLFLFASDIRIYSSHNPTVNSTNYEKVDLIAIGAPTHQLTLGKQEFKNDSIFDGTRYVPSQKNTFYFMFENPSSQPIKFNMIARTQETNIILRPGDRAETYIGGKNSTSWVFYSSHDNELIKLIVDFSIVNQDNQDQFREIAMAGLPVEGLYWAEKETQGEGTTVTVESGDIVDDHIRWGGAVVYRQVITTQSKKGKYIFNVANPFDDNILLGARLLRSEIGSLTLNQNSEHSSSLERGHNETFEIVLGHRGNWYLWVFACSGEIDVSVQDSSRELELESNEIRLPRGQEQLFKAHHRNGGVKTVTVKRSPNVKEDTQFFLSTSYFFENKMWDFDPINEDYKTKISYSNKVVDILLSTVQLGELEATDHIIYSIKLCPFDEKNKEHEWNICGSEADCKVINEDFKINSQPENMTIRFANVDYGSYYVKIAANIYHMEKMIKFIPYPLKTILLNEKAFLEVEPETSNTGTDTEIGEPGSETGPNYVLFGLVALVIIGGLGYWYFGKSSSSGARPGVGMQMQNFPQKKQQYEAVEEEATIVESAEPSEEKDEEK